MRKISTLIKERLHLRFEDGEPAWGGIFWALPMLYVFVDPYQRQAGWLEWLVTSLAFLAFFTLYLAGLLFWRRGHVVRRVCLAATILAVCYAAYRPIGAIFFPVIAAFLPFSVNGRIAPSAVLLGLLAAAFGVEWFLLGRDPSSFFFVLLSVSLIIGIGTTFAARQLLENERLFRNAERERIAQDLHDILGHTLSVIVLKSELAHRLMDAEPERARKEIRDVERVSRQALAEVRDAIQGYQTGGIQAEIEHARATLESAGIAVEHECGISSIPLAQERVLSLVLREAVTNILRHAKATACRLSVQSTLENYRMSISDNGRGGIFQEGLGMRSIRARVESLGGAAVWSGESGTVLTVTVPVTKGTSDS